MHNYKYFDEYYNELLADIYAQPSDEGHLQASNRIINKWILPLGISTVLDVGCGDASAQIVFENNDIDYTGISLGQDGKSQNPRIHEHDFNFLPYSNFDLIFARHVLEHSPFPLITLMEWHRVAKYLCVILPNPEHYTYVGKNHYSVMTSHHAAWLLRRAGWKMSKFYMDKNEIWFLCENFPRISYEGWAKVPLSDDVYAFERDMLEMKVDIDVKKLFARGERKFE